MELETEARVIRPCASALLATIDAGESIFCVTS